MKDTELSKKSIYFAKQKGLELKNKYKDLSYENKLESLIYKATLTLKTKNSSKFVEILLYLYSYVDKDIPDIFVKCLEDEDKLQLLGYAFLLGLKGENNNKEDKGED